MNGQGSKSKALFLALIANCVSSTWTLLLVFAGIGLFKQLTGGAASASTWIFNLQWLGIFVLTGFVWGAARTMFGKDPR